MNWRYHREILCIDYDDNPKTSGEGKSYELGAYK